MPDKPTRVVLAANGIGDRQIRVEEECERLLRLTSWMRECLEGELAGDMGTRERHGIDKATVEKWKALTTAFSTLTEAKIRLDKAAKQLAESKMTAEQETDVIRQWVRSRSPEDRIKFLEAELAWHANNIIH